MDYVTDGLRSLMHAAKETGKSIQSLPALIAVHAFISLIVQGIMYGLMQSMPTLRSGFGFGILIALLHAAAISFYLYGLDAAVHGESLKNISLRQGVGSFFRDTYIAIFIVYLLSLVVSMIPVPGAGWILLLALSALPEAIYLSRAQGYGVISEQFDFLKENWYIWIPVTLAGMGVMILFGFGLAIFPPVLLVLGSMNLLFRVFLYLVVFSMMALFRGHLFRYLYQSNLRKRRFMGNFR